MDLVGWELNLGWLVDKHPILFLREILNNIKLTLTYIELVRSKDENRTLVGWKIVIPTSQYNLRRHGAFQRRPCQDETRAEYVIIRRKTWEYNFFLLFYKFSITCQFFIYTSLLLLINKINRSRAHSIKKTCFPRIKHSSNIYFYT
jgi:hypothetical protein